MLVQTASRILPAGEMCGCQRQRWSTRLLARSRKGLRCVPGPGLVGHAKTVRLSIQLHPNFYCADSRVPLRTPSAHGTSRPIRVGHLRQPLRGNAAKLKAVWRNDAQSGVRPAVSGSLYSPTRAHAKRDGHIPIATRRASRNYWVGRPWRAWLEKAPRRISSAFTVESFRLPRWDWSRGTCC